MAIILHATPLTNQELTLLIDRVRNNLADVPEEMLESVVVYESLKRANQLVSQLVMADLTTPAYQRECIIAVGSLYAYQSYTALAARRLGNVPESAAATMANLQAVARALMHPVGDTPIKPDLTQNDEWISTLKPCVAIKGNSTLDLPIQLDPVYR